MLWDSKAMLDQFIPYVEHFESRDACDLVQDHTQPLELIISAAFDGKGTPLSANLKPMEVPPPQDVHKSENFFAPSEISVGEGRPHNLLDFPARPLRNLSEFLCVYDFEDLGLKSKCMDGREAMAFSSGSSPYYIHRGSEILGSGSGSQHGALHPPSGFRSLTSPHFAAQSNIRLGSPVPAFSIEPPNVNFGHAIDMAATSEVQVGEPVKKKRGRPRKYGMDGQVSLGLSPLPDKPKPSSGEDSSTPKRNRGRPPGSGRKQQLATLGEWMNSSAGQAFSPHMISIGVGEDIVSKLLSFSQQRPRAVCILSGTGTVSSVTLRQPASSGPSITYEGRFEILCLSGSYLVADDGGPRNRTGGISASLSSPDGHVIGGAIAMLIAASPVQVVVCSFLYGGSKKDKQVGRPKNDKDSAPQPDDNSANLKSVTPTSMPPQSFTPSPMSVWPGPRPVDMRNPHTDIDLTRG
ncbi:unnamed protein product [Dovyalis caffra]|uniref:AT-hook motif nuclear-localized protein n=1 Tax=Dovyalis caffra TaxID=77055 RepID=A0AAV1RJJ3_9ROSI|nr:unnamed protein product [Dovyalis caffra]